MRDCANLEVFMLIFDSWDNLVTDFGFALSISSLEIFVEISSPISYETNDDTDLVLRIAN